jgi:hypothetical protein
VSRDLEKMLSRFLDFGAAASGFGRNVWSVCGKTGVCGIAVSFVKHILFFTGKSFA